MTALAVTSVRSLFRQSSTRFRIGLKFRCIRSTPIEMQSISKNDFECLASTGVKTPVAMSSNFRSVRFNFLEADLVRNNFQIARSATAFLDRWRPRPSHSSGFTPRAVRKRDGPNLASLEKRGDENAAQRVWVVGRFPKRSRVE